MDRTEYAVFDIDGCLSDDRWRRGHLPDYNAYHARASSDRPVNREVVAREVAAQRVPLFVTARPDTYRHLTWEWLREKLPLDGADFRLLMRPEEDTVTRSPELKVRLLEETFRYVAADWDDVKVAYDDRPDVLGAYAARGVEHVVMLTAGEEQPEQQSVPEILESMANTFRERNATYGDTYLQFGRVCAEVWPRGLTVSGSDDFVRLGLVVQCLGKLLRYTATTEGHRDSAHDLAVYAAMLESVT